MRCGLHTLSPSNSSYHHPPLPLVPTSSSLQPDPPHHASGLATQYPWASSSSPRESAGLGGCEGAGGPQATAGGPVSPRATQAPTRLSPNLWPRCLSGSSADSRGQAHEKPEVIELCVEHPVEADLKPDRGGAVFDALLDSESGAQTEVVVTP